MGKTIIFDIDETLYSYSFCFQKAIQLLDEQCQELFSWEEGELKKLWKVAYQENIDRLGYDNACIHDTMLRIQNVLEIKGVNPLPYARRLHILFWDTVVDAMEPFDGVIDFVKKAKELGYCLGLATDLTVEIQFRKLEKLGLSELFDFIVTSEEAGCEKPHRNIFEMCLMKAGAVGEECLMIGDNWDRDIVGAFDLGMKAAWHVPGKNVQELDPSRRDIAFSSYAELQRKVLG